MDAIFPLHVQFPLGPLEIIFFKLVRFLNVLSLLKKKYQTIIQQVQTYSKTWITTELFGIQSRWK